MCVLKPRTTPAMTLKTNSLMQRDSSKTRDVLREVTRDAVSIPVKPVSSATTSFGNRMAEAGRVEIRGAHLAIVAFPSSQPYADSITLQFHRLSLQKKGNYVKIVCVVQRPATVPRSIPRSLLRGFTAPPIISRSLFVPSTKNFFANFVADPFEGNFVCMRHTRARYIHARVIILFCSCSPRLIDETQNHLPENA